MKPKLSLSYHSGRRGNGLLGIGWQLSGLSRITRCNKTIATDGYAQAPALDDADALCLDGNRLIRIADDGQTATFRQERDDFSQITGYYSDDPGVLGIASFEVVSSNGRVLTYGGTDESRKRAVRFFDDEASVDAWALSTIRDRNGNTIEYHYHDADRFYEGAENEQAGLVRDHRPRVITYATHPNDPFPQWAVAFAYENGRPDPRTAWRSGNQTVMEHRLSAITIAGPRQSRDIRLRYDDGAPGQAPLSRLRSIQECVASDGDATAACKSPTVVEYEQDGLFHNEAPGGDPTQNDPRLTLDFNGDGRDDLYVTQGGDASLWVSNTDAEDLQPDYRVVPLDDGWIPNGHWTRHRVLDYDGDGNDEIIDVNALGEVQIIEVNESGTTVTKVAGSRQKIFFIDLDGDSRLDLVSCVQDFAQPDANVTWSWRQLGPEGYEPGQTIDSSRLELKRCPLDRTATNPRARGGLGAAPYGSVSNYPLAPPKFRKVSRSLDVDGDRAQELLVLERRSAQDWDRVNSLPPAHWRYDVLRFSFELAGGSEGPRPILLGKRETRVPWESMPIDLNGDGLQDFYRLTHCERASISDGNRCARYGVPRIQAWLNTGEAFLPVPEIDLPAAQWHVVTSRLQPVSVVDRLGPINVPVGSGTRLSEIRYRDPIDEPPSGAETILGDTLRMAFHLSRPIDADGDGLQDLLLPLPGYGWSILKSTGTGLESEPLALDVPWTPLPGPAARLPELTGRQATAAIASYVEGYKRESPRIGDINGDGLPDVTIAVLDPSQMLDDIEQPVPTHFTAFLRRGPSFPRVIAITNGLGERVEVVYAHATDGRADLDPYRHAPPEAIAECVYPQQCGRYPRQALVRRHIVGAVTEPDLAFEPKRVASHFYVHAHSDLHGRGFLGFAKRQTVVAAAAEPEDQSTKTTYDFDLQRDEATGLYPGAFVPQETVTETLGPTVQRIARTTRRCDPNEVDCATGSVAVVRPAATSGKTLATYTYRRDEYTSEITDGFPEQVLRDQTTITRVDEYGNPRSVETGKWVEGDFSPYEPEGVRTRGVVYWHEDYPAFDVPGRRMLPRLVTEGFRIAGSDSPRDGPYNNTRTSFFAYDQRNNLVYTQREPLASGEELETLQLTRDFAHDAFGNVIQETTYTEREAPRETFTAYDDRGFLPIEVTDAQGFPAKVSYDPRFGTLERHEDYNELRTLTAFDGFGRVVREVEPDSTTTTVTYRSVDADVPLRVETRRQGGIHETSDYDPYGRQIATLSRGVRGQLLTSTRTYDDFDRLISASQPHEQGRIAEELTYTHFEYDATGRALRTSWLENVGDATLETSTHHCHVGLFSCTRNPRGFTGCRLSDQLGRTLRTYDPASTQASCEDALSAFAERAPSTLYKYSEFLEVIEGPWGNRMQMRPDRYGRKRYLADPDTGVTSYRWNPYGELVRQTNAEGETVEFDYDQLGRKVLRRDVDLFGADQHGETRWYWDGQEPGDSTRNPAQGELYGFLNTSEGATGHLKAYAYDDVGHLTDVTQTLADTGESFHVGFENFVLGRPTVIEYPSAAPLA